MSVGLPVVALLVPLAAMWVCRGGRLAGVVVPEVEPEPWSPAQRRSVLLFAFTALAWVTRTAPFGGWSALAAVPQVGDHTVALAAVVVACAAPDGRGGRLLDWPTAARVPWGLLLLFAGGIALGGAFATSGLDLTVASGLASLGRLPLPATLLALALAVTFLTEVTSNTATAALLMPILGTAAVAAGEAPTPWLVTAGLSASCAFMLPVATAPNAIVVGSGRVSTATLARTGFALNVIGAGVISAVVLALAR
jgi:sodium-dependent dicarboxylate transporter 2/3/5